MPTIEVKYRLKVVCQALGPGESLLAETSVPLKEESYKALVESVHQAKALCKERAQAELELSSSAPSKTIAFPVEGGRL